MATIPTPLLKDRTFSSVTVTDLFHSGSTFIQHGKVNVLHADEAVFDSLTVSNLIINGTITNTSAQTLDLGLSPNQLVATNGSGSPISFPYGSAAGQIAIRDSLGAISFTSWTTPENTTPQLALTTGASSAILVDFNFSSDCQVNVPDVGADANVVVYSSGFDTKNVFPSGHVLHLRSTANLAAIIMGTNTVALSSLNWSFGAGGFTKASIVTTVSNNKIAIIDNGNGNERISITATGVAQSDIVVAGGVAPIVSGDAGLSNGNLANRYRSLYMFYKTGSSDNFTNTISVTGAGPCILTLNALGGDSIGPMGSKDFTFNNTFIGPTTKFIISVINTTGTLNMAGTAMPYVYVKSTGTGTCTLRTCNLNSSLIVGNSMTSPIKVCVVLLS
jgi:hypothetical protein